MTRDDERTQQDALLSAAFAELDERELFAEDDGDYDVEEGLQRFHAWLEEPEDDARQQAAPTQVKIVNRGRISMEAPQSVGAEAEAGLRPDLKLAELLLQYEGARPRKWKELVTATMLALLAFTATSSVATATLRTTLSWPLTVVLVVVNITVAVAAIFIPRSAAHSQTLSVIQAMAAPASMSQTSRTRTSPAATLPARSHVKSRSEKGSEQGRLEAASLRKMLVAFAGLTSLVMIVGTVVLAVHLDWTAAAVAPILLGSQFLTFASVEMLPRLRRRRSIGPAKSHRESKEEDWM